MKKPNIFKGRTKEWDTNDWQGRTRQQVESNGKIMGYTFLVLAGMASGYGLVKLIMYVLG